MKIFINSINFLGSDRLLGVLILCFALLCLGFWIPLDIDTGLVETVRRRNIIGDSLGPVVAMSLVLGAALFLIRTPFNQKIFSNQGRWHRPFGFFLLVFFLSLTLMRYTGPLAIEVVSFVTQSDINYRNLRNIWPLKYIGFVCGGTLLLCCFSHFMDRSLNRKRVLLLLGICIAIAMFFDLPFEDILLPPNGDV